MQASVAAAPGIGELALRSVLLRTPEVISLRLRPNP